MNSTPDRTRIYPVRSDELFGQMEKSRLWLDGRSDVLHTIDVMTEYSFDHGSTGRSCGSYTAHENRGFTGVHMTEQCHSRHSRLHHNTIGLGHVRLQATFTARRVLT